MERLHSTRLTNIFLLAFFLTLLCLVPFVSTSMRTPYLYFLLNLLIIVLGVEAGFLTAISKPREDRKPPHHVIMSPATNYAETVTANITTTTTTTTTTNVSMFMEKPPIPTTIVDNKKKKSNVSSVKRVQSLKRCKSRPSLFFIGSGEPEKKEEVEKEEEVVAVRRGVEDVGELSKQELFSKAEMFIGNFYKQLKMQRENSWQKLQGF